MIIVGLALYLPVKEMSCDRGEASVVPEEQDFQIQECNLLGMPPILSEHHFLAQDTSNAFNGFNRLTQSRIRRLEAARILRLSHGNLHGYEVVSRDSASRFSVQRLAVILFEGPLFGVFCLFARSVKPGRIPTPDLELIVAKHNPILINESTGVFSMGQQSHVLMISDGHRNSCGKARSLIAVKK
jgi:hypothetical protein